jgi:flagellar biosynthesis protein FlhF
MQTQTYFAKSIEAAMVQARTELGADALLLKTQKATSESGQPGYQVSFGLGPLEDPTPAGVSSSEFRQLTAQLDQIRAALARSVEGGQKSLRPIPELSNLQARLIAAEIDPVLSKDIIDRVEAALAVEGVCQRADLQSRSRTRVRMLLNFDFDYIESLMRAELKRRIRIDTRIERKLTVFVGPTGSGKTTSLVKLAMSAGGRVRVMSLDSTPGAREEMKMHATNLGLDFVPLLTPAKLPKMVQSLKDADLILLDTPGFGTPDAAEADELAAALAQCPEADVFLVVAGYMKANDLQRSIQRYEKFRFSKLLVTKLDETGTLGSVVSEAARAGKSISYLTDGTRIPEDIRPATTSEILNLVLRNESQLEQSAA